MKNRFCLKTVALATVLILTGCVGSEKVDNSEISVTTTPLFLSDTSQITLQSTSKISLQTSTLEEKPISSNITENLKAVDFSSIQNALLDYICFARSEIQRAFLNGDECVITLRNVFGNEKPEMIVAIKKNQPSIDYEYYFSTDENDEPIYIGGSYGVHNAFCTDGEFVYSIREDEKMLVINKLQHPFEGAVSPDMAECQNGNALDFINDTHMYFIRYDNEDWDSKNQTWKSPEETASLFYCEDTGLYEAYSVSKRILELTSIEIGDIINGDGNLIYAYLPGENYIVSRQEYKQIKAKIFDVLIEINDEPEISSGWINVDDIDEWIDSLS